MYTAGGNGQLLRVACGSGAGQHRDPVPAPPLCPRSVPAATPFGRPRYGGKSLLAAGVPTAASRVPAAGRTNNTRSQLAVDQVFGA